MRQCISSGYGLEDQVGYSRAVRVGNLVFVAGTTARGETLQADAYTQAKAILEIAGQALEEAGSSLEDAVRTVVYLARMGDFEQVGRAHREAFHTARPACTMVEVSALAGGALVEIEITAAIG